MSDIEQSAAGTAATERYQALFHVSQTLISIRSSEELFRLLARELRAVVNFYVMGVGIYDEKAHEMHTTSYGEPDVPLGSTIRAGRNLQLVGVPAATALDNSVVRLGDSLPSGSRDAQEPRRSVGMRASIDDSTSAPRGPRFWQHRS